MSTLPAGQPRPERATQNRAIARFIGPARRDMTRALNQSIIQELHTARRRHV